MNRERVAILLCAALLGALLAAWAWAIQAGEVHAPEPWKNAYWPFTVELSVRDR